MSTHPLPVPPGQTPPFAVVTSTDHRAWIFIAAALGIVMKVLASAIRVFVRYTSKSSWGLDDFLLPISTVSMTRHLRVLMAENREHRSLLLCRRRLYLRLARTGLGNPSSSSLQAIKTVQQVSFVVFLVRFVLSDWRMCSYTTPATWLTSCHSASRDYLW